MPQEEKLTLYQWLSVKQKIPVSFVKESIFMENDDPP